MAERDKAVKTGLLTIRFTINFDHERRISSLEININ